MEDITFINDDMYYYKLNTGNIKVGSFFKKINSTLKSLETSIYSNMDKSMYEAFGNKKSIDIYNKLEKSLNEFYVQYFFNPNGITWDQLLSKMHNYAQNHHCNLIGDTVYHHLYLDGPFHCKFYAMPACVDEWIIKLRKEPDVPDYREEYVELCTIKKRDVHCPMLSDDFTEVYVVEFDREITHKRKRLAYRFLPYQCIEESKMIAFGDRYTTPERPGAWYAKLLFDGLFELYEKVKKEK